MYSFIDSLNCVILFIFTVLSILLKKFSKSLSFSFLYTFYVYVLFRKRDFEKKDKHIVKVLKTIEKKIVLYQNRILNKFWSTAIYNILINLDGKWTFFPIEQMVFVIFTTKSPFSIYLYLILLSRAKQFGTVRPDSTPFPNPR